MRNGVLVFDNSILCLEQKDMWKGAADLAYVRWEQRPDNLNDLLCAGTEIWYALLINDYYHFAPYQTIVIDPVDVEEMEEKLWRIAQFGEQFFSENANFNAYFGYMYKVKPHYFLGYGGDFDGWQNRGCAMLQKSALLDQDNLFAVAMSHEIEDESCIYLDACKTLWKQITPEQWGFSEVQLYFFRILNGDRFHSIPE